MKITELTPAHTIKLASLAVHVEEFFENQTSMVKAEREAAAQFDLPAIRGLLADPQVREVLDDPANKVFLPVKRE